MRKPLALSQSKIAAEDVKCFTTEWFLETELQQLSPKTLTIREEFLGKFLWFLEERDIKEVGSSEIKSFLLYLSKGHLEKGGRFGNPKLTNPLRPISVNGYYRVLRGFFNWLESEELIEANPMGRVKAPTARTENKQPISDENVIKLLHAAKNSTSNLRDEALLLLLLDTGLRASEICSLQIGDIDVQARSFKVVGKGNKIRMGHFGCSTLKSLFRYLRSRKRAATDEPLFLSRKGGKLTVNGLKQLTERLAKVAGIEPSLCGPHAFRRTFAVNIIRAGANLFSVQSMLGHTDLQMTRKYVQLAESDIENQHRQFSPVDRMRSRSR